MDIEGIDWQAAGAALGEQGWATLPRLLDPSECLGTADSWHAEHGFRSRVVMARHGFGQGEYRYFAHDLPERVASLRAALYPRLADVANRWQLALGLPERFPESHPAYLDLCLAAGQARPTP